MRFLSNCLLAAVVAKVRAPRQVRIEAVRNKHGRLHFVWSKQGARFEFYAPCRSRMTYLQNALYVGRVREVPR
jgi:hypothetical protein